MGRIAWSWGSKISDQLLLDGLSTASGVLQGQVLDLGCGKKPYRSLLNGRVSRVIGLDLPVTASGPSHADVFGSALAIPFRTGTFDAVICTQVLEHVEQPDLLMQEASRSLRPGGSLVLSAPQTNPLHEEPRDYYRFTCYSLSWMAEQAGLTVDEVRPIGGAIATLGQMLVWHSGFLRRIPVLGPTLSAIVNVVLARVILLLDRLSPRYGGGAMKDTLGWVLVARKRSAS